MTPQNPDNQWAQAQDSERRARTSLYLVVFSARDPLRRRRLRQLLAAFGVEIAPFTFEVPTSIAGARLLERSLSFELGPDDTVRLYPVCARCRAGTRVWGDVELSGLTPALIF